MNPNQPSANGAAVRQRMDQRLHEAAEYRAARSAARAVTRPRSGWATSARQVVSNRMLGLGRGLAAFAGQRRAGDANEAGRLK